LLSCHQEFLLDELRGRWPFSLEAELEMEIYNKGGNLVKGKGVYEISGRDIFVFPNAEGWSIRVTATATDESGNSRTESTDKALKKCKK
jgi:hypothetical protein